jgi:hypothetical protein
MVGRKPCPIRSQISKQIAIRRPIRPHGMALTEVPYGRALDLDPRGLIQGGRQLFIGPMRSVEPTTLGASLHPPLDRRRQRLGHQPRLAWGPWDRSALYPPFMIWFQPQLHGGAMHPQIVGDGLALTPPTGHQDRPGTGRGAVGRCSSGRGVPGALVPLPSA